MTQEQFVANENFQEELSREALKRSFLKRCDVIRKWMKEEDKIIQENTLDIPEFLKSEEDQFESRFNRGIQNAINKNEFWQVYDNALLSLGC